MRIGFGSLSPGPLQKGTVTHSKVVQPASGDGASPRHGAQSTTGDADSGNDRETIRVDQSNECGAPLVEQGGRQLCVTMVSASSRAGETPVLAPPTVEQYQPAG